MARAALPRGLTWQQGSVIEVVDETARVKSIVLELPDWPGYRAGQHVDVRLTAQDGYQAQRSYSIASCPEDGYLVITVERIDDGEVSPYLADALKVGDELELRGPLGGYFVWDDSLGDPVLLVASGSGIVPFRAMLRHRAAVDGATPVRLLYSSRSQAELIYRDELLRFAAYDEIDIRFALTREWPDSWRGYRGRVGPRLLADFAWTPDQRPLIYGCGPSTFVETVASALLAIGHDPAQIRTERFGPAGC